MFSPLLTLLVIWFLVSIPVSLLVARMLAGSRRERLANLEIPGVETARETAASPLAQGLAPSGLEMFHVSNEVH